MSKHEMSAANFLRTLPGVLRSDEQMQALATVIASEMEKLSGEVQLAQIYTRIDDMDEALLDALAADFKVDWWRPDSPIEEKRKALKMSWYVHKHLGTKSAIETAVADYLGNGKVEEWFEYGGQPHHFKISSWDNDAIIANFDEFMSVLDVVQRRSAVLEHITAVLLHKQEIYMGIISRTKKIAIIPMEAAEVSSNTFLVNELSQILMDNEGNILIP